MTEHRLTPFDYLWICILGFGFAVRVWRDKHQLKSSQLRSSHIQVFTKS